MLAAAALIAASSSARAALEFGVAPAALYLKHL
jgi:hypothetical protein